MTASERMVAVLYVRCEGSLLARLDAQVAVEQAAQPGRRVSRADVVRGILEAALAKESGI